MAAIEKILIVGPGTMGEGIAQAFAQNGFEVRLVARREGPMARALGQLRQNVQPRAIRRLTHRLAVRLWKRAFLDDFQVHPGREFYGLALIRSPHHFDEIKGRWTDADKRRG